MVADLSSAIAEVLLSWSAILGYGYNVILVIVVSGLVLQVQRREEAMSFLCGNEIAMK